MARILRAKTATFYGTGAGVAINGLVAAGLSDAVVQRMGRSDGEIGHTSIDNVADDVSGFLIVDDEDEDLALLLGTTGALVITFARVGGADVTLTIGNTGTPTTCGVLFTGADDITIDVGDASGPTPRIRLPFVGVFLSTHTQVINSSTTPSTTSLLTWSVA